MKTHLHGASCGDEYVCVHVCNVSVHMYMCVCQGRGRSVAILMMTANYTH